MKKHRLPLVKVKISKGILKVFILIWKLENLLCRVNTVYNETRKDTGIRVACHTPNPISRDRD